MITKINYKLLYADILNELYPNKRSQCQLILDKCKLSIIDILELNKLIFGEQYIQNSSVNQKFKSYSKEDIIYLLDYQKKYKLNNTQLANQFKISRNTIAKWKKIFI